MVTSTHVCENLKKNYFHLVTSTHVCENLKKKIFHLATSTHVCGNLKKYFHLATSAHVCENQIFIFQLDFCAEFYCGPIDRLGRHVTLFTSNDKFEARGFTIITLQDSQDEISEFTSKLWNPPLVTLNCNNNFGTFSSCYTG